MNEPEDNTLKHSVLEIETLPITADAESLQESLVSTLEENLLKPVVEETEVRNPRVLNKELSYSTYCNSTPGNEESQLNYKSHSTSQQPVMDTFISNEEEPLNDSQSERQCTQIPFYGDAFSDIGYEIAMSMISPHDREMSCNDDVPNLVPEKVEKIQQSDLRSTKICQDEASGSENFLLHNFSETFDRTSTYNRERKATTDSKMSCINEVPKFSLTNKGMHMIDKLDEMPLINTGGNTASKINDSPIDQSNETIFDSFSSNNESIEENVCSTVDHTKMPGSSSNRSDICFLCNNYITEHWKEDIKLYKCCFCKYTGKSKYYLKSHFVTHGSNPFSCNICEETFEENFDHDTVQPCKICEKMFQCKTFLLEHLLVHKSHCPICRETINAHKSENKGKNCYKCCKCPSLMQIKGNMYLHFFTHFIEKAFRCDECGNRFAKGRSLTQHKRKMHFSV